MPKLLDNPCPRCNWKYAGGHLCLKVATPDYEPVIRAKDEVKDPKRKKKQKRAGVPRSRDSVHRQEVETVRQSRAATSADATQKEKIIALYTTGNMTMREIAKIMDYNDRQVMHILHEAQDKGLVTIRKAARRTSA